MKIEAKIITIVFLLTFLYSCNPEKRIARMQAKWCTPFEHNDTIVTHNTDTVTFETIKEVTLPPNPDTLLIFAKAYCDSANNAQMSNVYVTDGNNSANISIKDNDLQAEIICHEDSLKQIIKIKETRIKELESTKINTEKIRYKIIGKWYKYFFWLVIAMVIIVMLVSVVFKRLRF